MYKRLSYLLLGGILLLVSSCGNNKGAFVNAKAGYGMDNPLHEYEMTPLHQAALSGHEEVVVQLLAYGAKVDETNSAGSTALHFAAINGHIAVVECLIEYGVDVHARDNTGATPLHKAAMKGHAGVAALLRANGATE